MTVPLADVDLRRDLLGGLYRRAVESPEARWVSRDALLRGLATSEGVLFSAVSELRRKGLVETDGDPWERVTISERGLKELAARELNFCPLL